MSLFIILTDIPWFKKWELEVTFYVDLKQWCWFDHHYIGDSLTNSVLAEDFELTGEFLEFDVSILCFTLILEGDKL